MRLPIKIVEPLEGSWHKCCEEIVPKILKALAHQFMLGELLWTSEGKSPPSRHKVHEAFFLLLFCFYLV